LLLFDDVELYSFAGEFEASSEFLQGTHDFFPSESFRH